MESIRTSWFSVVSLFQMHMCAQDDVCLEGGGERRTCYHGETCCFPFGGRHVQREKRHEMKTELSTWKRNWMRNLESFQSPGEKLPTPLPHRSPQCG